MTEKKVYKSVIKTLRTDKYKKLLEESLLDPLFKDKEFINIKHKVLALRALANGNGVVEVSTTFMVGKSTLNLWGTEFIENGLVGIMDEKAGIKTKYTEEIGEKLREAIRKTPRDYGYDFDSWTVKLVSLYLNDFLKISLKPQTTSIWMKWSKIVMTRPKKNLS